MARAYVRPGSPGPWGMVDSSDALPPEPRRDYGCSPNPGVSTGAILVRSLRELSIVAFRIG
jgi:hypothetical protein